MKDTIKDLKVHLATMFVIDVVLLIATLWLGMAFSVVGGIFMGILCIACGAYCLGVQFQIAHLKSMSGEYKKSDY